MVVHGDLLSHRQPSYRFRLWCKEDKVPSPPCDDLPYLISTLSQYAGSEYADEIAAAVFVYRILTWLLPVPLGGFAFTRWRDGVRASGDEELLDAFADAEDLGG